MNISKKTAPDTLGSYRDITVSVDLLNRNIAGELKLVVPDRRAFRPAVDLQFYEPAVGDFVYVLGDFRWMTIDNTSELSDTRRVVLGDGFEQFEICWPEDTAEGCEAFNTESRWH